LAELREVSRERSLLGPSGVGKTHLAISLGYLAVEAGYNVRFRTAQDLVDSLYASLADGNFKRELERYGKFDLLIIDELGCQRSVNSPGVRQIIHPSW
jgi:DNA replication protein DnaC